MSRAAVTGHGSAGQALPASSAVCVQGLVADRESHWQTGAPLGQTVCPDDSYHLVEDMPIAYRRVCMGSLQEPLPQKLPASAGKSSWFAGEELTGAGEDLRDC